MSDWMDPVVERAWCSLKERCASDPEKAVRLVMIGRADIAAALDASGLRECVEALNLAANRLNLHAVNAIADGEHRSIEYSNWADEARSALQKVRP